MAVKFKKSQQKGAPPWLVSMGDMNNLLMCFFIVLMGEDVPTIKAHEDFTLIFTAFKGNVGVMEGGLSISKGKLANLGQNILKLPSTEKKKAFTRTIKRATEILKPELLARTVRLREDERGLIITLASDVFFDPGSAAILKEMKPVMRKIAKIISEFPNYIRIEGHTDNVPVAAGQKRGYDTNWELSAARSVNVLRFLAEEEKIDQKRMSAVAFGQYRPVDDNNIPEGRSLNRRVDIVILKDKEIPEDKKHPEISRPLPDEEWK